MAFVSIFWKNNIQEAYLPKTSIVKQIVSEILALFCSDDSIQILLNLTCQSKPFDPSQIYKDLNLSVESSEHNWAISQRQFAPQMLIFGK